MALSRSVGRRAAVSASLGWPHPTAIIARSRRERTAPQEIEALIISDCLRLIEDREVNCCHRNSETFATTDNVRAVDQYGRVRPRTDRVGLV